MPSFRAKLIIGDFSASLDSFVMELNQHIDALGRPASPTFGGTITMAFDTPDDPLITKWMFDPVMQKSGIVKLRDLDMKMLKEIQFINAFCTHESINFDGTHSTTKMTTTITISPEDVIVSDMKHSNGWAPIEAGQ